MNPCFSEVFVRIDQDKAGEGLGQYWLSILYQHPDNLYDGCGPEEVFTLI